MIVVADSGATKTDWRIVEGDTVLRFETTGLSPYFNTREDFVRELTRNIPSGFTPESVSAVFFYGSGCGTAERGNDVARYLSVFFANARVEAHSDALGAARALFGRGEGIVAILGTGSNITRYNGTDLDARTPSLGYVLGDEGSGAYMGRLLLRAYFYGSLTGSIRAKFEAEFNPELSDVLHRVYGESKPSAFLASFVPFIIANASDGQIAALIDTAFSDMCRVHLQPYADEKDLPIGVVGSVGCLLSERLDRVASQHGFTIARYLRYPVEELVKYHRGDC